MINFPLVSFGIVLHFCRKFSWKINKINLWGFITDNSNLVGSVVSLPLGHCFLVWAAEKSIEWGLWHSHCLSPLSWSWNLKESHLFSCDFPASTWWRLCKVSFKWDIHHLQPCSLACRRLSHSSTWDVNKDNAFDFHIDLVCLRAWLPPQGLFPDQMAFHWPHLSRPRISVFTSPFPWMQVYLLMLSSLSSPLLLLILNNKMKVMIP